MKKKLTKAEMRVAIAKDAIKQVKEKKMIPSHRGYVSFSKPIGGDLQKSLKTVNCTVCELGGLFISAVRLFNDFTLCGDSYGVTSGDITPKLLKYFPRKQLSMMETAYEKEIMSGAGTYYEEDSEYTKLKNSTGSKCVAFGRKYEHPSDRFIAICKNIIKNNGTFKP